MTRTEKGRHQDDEQESHANYQYPGISYGYSPGKARANAHFSVVIGPVHFACIFLNGGSENRRSWDIFFRYFNLFKLRPLSLLGDQDTALRAQPITPKRRIRNI